MPNPIDIQGREGEQALSSWLQAQQLSYVAVCQSPQTFSPLFTGNVKRPDFLVLLESVGLIAVDAKNYALSGGVYTLELEAEFRRAIAFERLFRIPLWYAYLASSTSNSTWYWISALKAIEVGAIRTNSKTNVQFLAIKLAEFEQLTSGGDLSKLYTHRLPGTSKIAGLPLR